MEQQERISAHVIPLPTATKEPVKQHPRRRRFPKCITNIADARFKRFLKEYNQKKTALDIKAAIANALKFEATAQSWHQHAMHLQGTLENTYSGAK